MKSYKILLFILLTITCLALVSALFPKDGIVIGNVTFRFPSLETVLIGHQKEKKTVEESFQVIEDTIDENVESLRDTIRYFRQIVETHPARFYLPSSRIDFLDLFFNNIEQAKADHRIVRILHYGDSQIEMDRISNNLRSYFQEHFGGGGPGLVPLSQNIPSFSVSQYASGNFSTYACYGDGIRTQGGNYGIMAKCFSVIGSGTFTAKASSYGTVDEKVKRFSHVKLLLNNRQSSFTATLNDRKHHYEQETSCNESGVHILTWELDTPTTSLKINFSGQADIYGIMLDDGYGVSVDNIPLRGSSGTIFTQINDSLLRQSYAASDVGLIIMQFGGNSVPSIWTEKSIATFKERVAAQIRHISTLYPEAPIIYIGPSDMSTRHQGVLKTYPYLPAIIQALKEAATENGAAYWDIYDVMGGENSMITWVENGLAGNDYIHFTTKGAEKIGKALSNTFANYYQLYLLRKEVDTKQFNTLWNDTLPLSL